MRIWKYWRSIGGGLLVLWKPIEWFLQWAEHIEFVSHHFPGVIAALSMHMAKIPTSVDWSIPVVGLLFLAWDHLWFRKINSAESASLREWKATPEIVASLKALSNAKTSVDIIFFDPPHFPFAERLASAFEAAGWSVNFTKTAQGQHNPYHHGGIEVKGDNRYFVENIATALSGSGCVSVKPHIGATALNPSSPKYEIGRNRVWITIGYAE